MYKINVIRIIKGHFATLVNANTNKPGIDDYFSFLLLPILFSILFIWLGFELDSDSIGVIIGSLAIFVGLLFNALVILLDIARKHDNQRIKRIIVKEITANIAFSIFLSFVIILVILMVFIEDLPPLANTIINFFSFFLVAEFLFIFLMVLKRTYLIFIDEFENE